VKRSTILLFTILFLAVSACSQNTDDDQISATKVSENIYMLQGPGANMGLCIGKNGIFLIDDKFAPLHERIISKIHDVAGNAVPDKSRMFIINTHFHGDHTGGNELMGEAGAVIIAHDNVRKRLSTEQFSKFFNRTTPPLAEIGLPIITFTTGLTFHLNDDSIQVIHLPPAHTDGDAIVHFIKANVIHAGDLLFTGRYPIIDLERGGSVLGMIENARKIASMCNEDTKVIPGHGSLSDKSGLEKFANMLSTIRSRVSDMVAEGKTLDEILAAHPAAEFDTELNDSKQDDRFLGVIYLDVTKK
jgi:cyclase